MKEDTARSILRLIAVVTILVGACLTSATLVQLVSARGTLQGVPQGMQVKMQGMVAEMGFYAVLSHLVIAAWGVVLYFSSPMLAAKITE